MKEKKKNYRKAIITTIKKKILYNYNNKCFGNDNNDNNIRINCRNILWRKEKTSRRHRVI